MQRRNRADAGICSAWALVCSLLVVGLLVWGNAAGAQLGVRAWGLNNGGQLGDGTTDNHYTPIAVSGLTNVIAIATGASHSLALKSDGTVWVWGANLQSTPVAVSGLTGVIAIAAGWGHSLALKSDGTMWAWGGNGSGQLGDGTTIDRSTPVQVSGLTEVIAISGGAIHSLALKSDGKVWAWGLNQEGQLGNSFYRLSATPLAVSGLTGVVAIAAGGGHSLALQAAGVIQGQYTLEESVSSSTILRFEFRPVSGGDPILRTRFLPPMGTFSFFDIPQGTYNIAIKGEKWLQQVLPNVSTAAGNSVLDLTVFLRAGDANDDNMVDVEDLNQLIQAFDADPTSPNWNEGRADFNGNDIVGVEDLGLLIRNFGREGDP